MCKGISITLGDLRQELIQQHELERRITTRTQTAPPELHFMYSDANAELPVFHNGRSMIYLWGNRDNRTSRLPLGGWCKTESLETGRWRWLNPEPVEIPADFGWEKGVWFQVVQGIRAVVVKDEQRCPHVYMLTKPATHYFAIMTKCDRMPVLIEQEI